MDHKVPEGWRKEKLERLCTKLKSGGTPSVSNPKYYNGNISFVKIEDMTKNGTYIENTRTNITKEGLKNSSAWLIPKNSILFSIYASVGEVAITKRELATNQAIMGLCPDGGKIDTRYLYEYLRYIKPSLSKYFKTTTQKNLTAAIAKDLEISHPASLQEQQKIAAILTTVDENIEETDKIIAECERVKKGLMQDFFIAHKSELVELGAYAYVKARIGWRGLSSKEYTQEGPYLIAGQHIIGSKIDWKSCDHISMFRYDESPEIQLKVNDVIISKDGTIGRVGFIDKLPEKATINGTMMLIRSNDTRIFHPKYLYYYLQGPYFQSLIREKVSGSSVPHIFQRDIVKLNVPKVPLKEQIRITNIFTEIDRRVELETDKLFRLKIMKKSLMQKLLSGEIRVKVN